MIEQRQFELISYGLGNQFRPDFWTPIRNRDRKPFGGLWTSPVGISWGWKDWCRAEEWGDLSSVFRINYEGRTLVIDSKRDARELPMWVPEWAKNSPSRIRWPDFECLVAEGIEGIYMTEHGQVETRFGLDNPWCDLYGWDCECVLVMRLESLFETAWNMREERWRTRYTI